MSFPHSLSSPPSICDPVELQLLSDSVVDFEYEERDTYYSDEEDDDEDDDEKEVKKEMIEEKQMSLLHNKFNSYHEDSAKKKIIKSNKVKPLGRNKRKVNAKLNKVKVEIKNNNYNYEPERTNVLSSQTYIRDKILKEQSFINLKQGEEEGEDSNSSISK